MTIFIGNKLFCIKIAYLFSHYLIRIHKLIEISYKLQKSTIPGPGNQKSINAEGAEVKN